MRFGDLLRNPANAWLALGALALAAAGWLPHAKAARAARAETAAALMTRLLLKGGRALPRLDFTDPRIHELLTERVARRASRPLRTVPLPSERASFAFATDDYALLLTRAEPSEATPSPTLEAYAWPLTAAADGHAAFFVAEDLPGAHTRNLFAGYSGFAAETMPHAGAARPRDEAELGDMSWRGMDDERWMALWRRP